MLVEDETNNSTDAEIENQFRAEKGDDAKNIRTGIRFFYKNLNLLDVELLQEAEKCIVKMV